MQQHTEPPLSMLFIVNGKAGPVRQNLKQIITSHFSNSSHNVHIWQLEGHCSKQDIQDYIKKINPGRVIAAGGDGTVKLVAEALLHSPIPLGILPCGSANGLARELNIPVNLQQALDTVTSNNIITIHATRINNEVCIHLADLGFNAYVVKIFDEEKGRGMLTYAKAALKAMWTNKKMEVCIEVDDNSIETRATMVVIANATSYGTGVTINPVGTLTDKLFEIVLVKKPSLLEILKMRFIKRNLNPKKTRVYSTDKAVITPRGNPVHFQVDGEYLGKIKSVKAEIIPNALQIIVPE